MKRYRFFATSVANYLELPNSSLSLRSCSSYGFDSFKKDCEPKGLLSYSPLHTPRKSQRLYVGRWLTALCLSLGPVASYAQVPDDVQRDTVRGTARVAYAINHAKVSSRFSENSQELERINRMLELLLTDSTATLQRVVIRGYGSPDGRYGFNEQLARERTDNLKAYVAQHANLPEDLIKVEYVAEDWDGLSALVEEVPQKDMPHRDEVLKVIKGQQQPDEKERIIRKQYPADFQYLKNICLPKLRRADYSIEYLTRNSSVAANSSAVVSVSSASASTGAVSAGDKSTVAGTDQTAATASQTAAVTQQLKQSETDQKEGGGSNGRLMLWLAIIAGLLLLLLLAAFIIRNLYRNIKAKDKNLKRLLKDLDYYRAELQKYEAEKLAEKSEVDSVPVAVMSQPEVQPEKEQPEVQLEEEQPELQPEEVQPEMQAEEELPEEEPEDTVEPEVAPVVVSAPVVAPISVPASKAEEPKPADEPSEEIPVVAQNSEIPGDNQRNLKYESFEGGDSDDYERFKLMDQVVTEQKLFLRADINRRKLMRLAGVDKNRFALMMRNCANTNFAGYINSKRMEYALQLIKEHPEYTMKNIAEACGFSSQSTFFRVFKSVYGVTPTEFSQTGLQPKGSTGMPLWDVVSKSQKGQNSNNTISFDAPFDGADEN